MPFPVRVNTSGTVTNGVSVGHAPEIDCAKVSIGEREAVRKPKPARFRAASIPFATRAGVAAPDSSDCRRTVRWNK